MKLVLRMGDAGPYGSPPARGARIETIIAIAKTLDWKSPPARGARIETRRIVREMIGIESPPARGARIETFAEVEAGARDLVAPRTGGAD